MFLLAAAMESVPNPGGQEGLRRSSRKCMNPMHRKFADLLVSRVYLADHGPVLQSSAPIGVACAGSTDLMKRKSPFETVPKSTDSGGQSAGPKSDPALIAVSL